MPTVQRHRQVLRKRDDEATIQERKKAREAAEAAAGTISRRIATDTCDGDLVEWLPLHSTQSPYQGEEARAASERVRSEMRRVVAMVTGNFDYWGLPYADRPTASPGAQERDDEGTVEERQKFCEAAEAPAGSMVAGWV